MAEKVLIGNVRGLQGPPGPPGAPGAPGRDVTVDSELNENSTNAVQNAAVAKKLNEVFQSVSEGKKLVASAITDKGVATKEDVKMSEMAKNIRAIQSGSKGGFVVKIQADKPVSNSLQMFDNYNYEMG